MVASNLKGKTAVVTGSGRAIGAAIALRLAEDGANVVVNSRSTPDEIEEVAEQCRFLGVESLAVLADVAVKSGVEDLARQTLQVFKSVDILINNVGVSPTCSFLEMTDEEWHTVMGVNINSIYYCCKAMVPSMVQKGWGRVLNITGHAYLEVGGSVHTKAGKAAAVGFTRGLAGDLAPYEITVNHIAPGLIDTPPRRNKYYHDDKPAHLRPWGPEERVEEVPLKRLGKPEEMASLASFLCSDEAAYLTGQTYLVNGGMAVV
jgi:3-oxoacyl-[acyl-carrier protein] reductase